MQQPPPRQISLLGAPDDPNELSLVELADRLLNRGVVLTGEAMISVAGVDLIYLGLNLVLTAVENLPRSQAGDGDAAVARDLLGD